MKKPYFEVGIVVLVVLLVSLVFWHHHLKSSHKLLTSSAISVQSGRYVRDVDGDTIVIVYQGVTQNVRLIGIDTPESKRNAKAKLDSKTKHIPLDTIIKEGKAAAEFTKAQFTTSNIQIETDKQLKDKYGRLLAYVYLNGTMLNSTIISEGYAYPMTVKPNVKYASQFAQLYAEAVAGKKGLWK